MIYTIFTQQFIFSILSLLFTYSIGKLITSFFEIKGNFFFRLFVSYIIGITTIVLFYSIIKAHGRTINIILLPIIGYLLYYVRNSFTKSPKFDKKEIIQELIWSLLSFLLLFLFQSWFYFDFTIKSIKSVFPDFYWYSTMTESLTLWGAESRLTEMNLFFPEYRQGLLPYHYPELWFTSFFSSIWKNSSINTYYFTTSPLLVITYMLGLCSLFEKLIKHKFIVIILGLVLLFTSGFILPFYIVKAHNTWGIIDIVGQKLGFIYCFIILSLILLTSKQKDLGLLLLVIIPIFSVTFIPSIWFGTITFCLLIKLFSKDYLTNKQIFLVISSIIYLVIGFIVFYIINKSEYVNDFAIKKIFNSGIFKNTYGNYTFLNLKTICCNFVVYTIPSVLIHVFVRIYLFSIFLVLLAGKTIKNWKLFFLILSILLYGATITTLSIELFDHDQFIEALSAFLIVFSIILIADFYSTNHHFVAKCLLGGILICIYYQGISETLRNKNISSKIDIHFLQNINDCLTDNTNVVLMFISEKDTKECASFHFLFLSNELLPLSQFSNKKIITTIANPEKYIQYKQLNYTDSFNYFQLNPINVWKSKGKSLQSFISNYNIKYFYFKDGVEIPSFISENTERIIESTTTHSKFIKTK